METGKNVKVEGGELTVCGVPVPEIQAHEVLVKIKTAGVNPLDNMIVTDEEAACFPTGITQR